MLYVIPDVSILGNVFQYDTRTNAAAAIILPSINVVQTGGYTTVGDGGGAFYIKGATNSGGSFLDATGQRWVLAIQPYFPEQFGARGNNVTDDSAAINTACTFINKGTLNYYAKTYVINASILNPYTMGMNHIGEGPDATIIRNVGLGVHAFNIGTVAQQTLNTSIQNLTILGSASTGDAVHALEMGDSCALENVYVNNGARGFYLSRCYSITVRNCRIRSVIGDGIYCDAVTHDITITKNKIQNVGGNAISMNGCYAWKIYDNCMEFNIGNGVLVTGCRSGSIGKNYYEGFPPKAGGKYAVNLVSVDTCVVEDDFYDATATNGSTGPFPTNGTGNFIFIGAACSRVCVDRVGFAAIDVSQYFLQIQAGSTDCQATLPYLCSYDNFEPNCRVDFGKYRETGVQVKKITTAQVYTFNQWNVLVFDSVDSDTKAEYATGTSLFTPRDYGVYNIQIAATVAALAANRGAWVRFRESVSGFVVKEMRAYIGLTGTLVLPVSFTCKLTKGVTYVAELFLDDTVNRSGSIADGDQNMNITRIH